MELKIIPTNKNVFPLGGLLIKGSSPKNWLLEIQNMGLSIDSVITYPIPDNIPNSIWGCLLVTPIIKNKIEIGRNFCCQIVDNILFIPEYAVLYPQLNAQELATICNNELHILHPEFGLVALKEGINWSSLLLESDCKPIEIRIPAFPTFIPNDVKSFYQMPTPPEDLLAELEKTTFPKYEKMEEKNLNLIEKARLNLYKNLFKKEKISNQTIKKPLMDIINQIGNQFYGKNTIANYLEEDYENLVERNKKQIDKFLEMMKKNPLEALKFAIPLDKRGVSRGSKNGLLGFYKIWADFSLFSNNNASAKGGILMDENVFAQLESQYYKTAQELIQKSEYEKAAFIYIKLLKNHYLAAQTLENGKKYKAAAAIYLLHLKNKIQAAICYEKGGMIREAIDLYKQLENHEKVGDLYKQINCIEEANESYEKVINSYKNSSKYVKASLIYKYKMNNKQAGQTLLLDGWKKNRDAYNCLNNYIENFDDLKQRKEAIQKIYEKDVSDLNSNIFLQAIKLEFNKNNEISEYIKTIAYEIIVSLLPKNKNIIKELNNFNKADKLLSTDILHFKIKNI